MHPFSACPPQLLAVPKRFLFSPVAAATPYVVYNAPAMKVGL